MQASAVPILYVSTASLRAGVGSAPNSMLVTKQSKSLAASILNACCANTLFAFSAIASSVKPVIDCPSNAAASSARCLIRASTLQLRRA